MKLEEKLVSLRKEKGLSQLKLAEMMDVSRQAVSKWEVGSAVPSTDNLKYLGQLYGVSLEYLLRDDALEPNADPEKIASDNTAAKRKSLWIALTIILLLALVAGIVFYTHIGKESDEIIPIEELSGDPTWEDFEAEGFSLEW